MPKDPEEEKSSTSACWTLPEKCAQPEARPALRASSKISARLCEVQTKNDRIAVAIAKPAENLAQVGAKFVSLLRGK